jgi:hypothetical protein
MAQRHTASYLAFKTEAERLTNLVALISHAVPVMTRVLASPEASALIPIKPADNFPHDNSTAPLLTRWAKDYSQDLAHIVVLTVFSQFEAYVRGALMEIYDRQGGAEAFISLAVKQAEKYWSSIPTTVSEAKAKLLDSYSTSKADKFRKYSKVLVEAGFSFPPDLFAVFGARQLLKKLQPKAFRAWEIPDLLADALLLKVTAAERTMYTDIRELRNKVAHGDRPTLTVHTAVTKTTALRKWASKIDQHIVEHFLVLARYAR